MLISAPAKGVDLTVVYGVNDDKLTAEHKIVSNASCTTNCLAPVAKVLNDALGIERGLMTTVHAYTNDQKILDQIHPGPAPRSRCGDEHHPDDHRRRPRGRRGASGAQGQARRLGRPRAGARRQPDRPHLHAEARHDARGGQPDPQGRERERTGCKGVLVYSEDPLVSSDIVHTPQSSTVDSLETAVLEGKLVRVVSWYDNEWGFSNRMVDTACAMAQARLRAVLQPAFDYGKCGHLFRTRRAERARARLRDIREHSSSAR